MHVLNFFFIFLQWNVFQYPFQRRVTKAVQFLRETGRKVIEVRKSAMKRGEEVPDDILQHIIQQQGLLAFLSRETLTAKCVHFKVGAQKLIGPSGVESFAHKGGGSGGWSLSLDQVLPLTL